MKKTGICIASILICASAFAQKDSARTGEPYLRNSATPAKQKFSISANIGAGIPMEDYGNTSQTPFSNVDTTHIAGLATTGFHFNLNASYLFSKFFGPTIMIGGTLNTFDEAQWQALRSAAVPGITTSVSGSFYIGQYLIGPYASLPVSDKVQIEFKALFGILTANYPIISQTYPANYGINIPNFNYGEPTTQVKTIATSSDFGYYFGTGIKYMATNHIGISLNVGYTGSDVGYPNVTVTYDQSGSSIYTKYSTHTRYMQLGIFQTTAGVSYNW